MQGEFQDGIWRLKLKGNGDSWELAPLEYALQAPLGSFGLLAGWLGLWHAPNKLSHNLQQGPSRLSQHLLRNRTANHAGRHWPELSDRLSGSEAKTLDLIVS